LKTSSKANSGVAARRAAINALAGGDENFNLSGKDRAFALRLLRESIVWRARLDRALARFCSRPLEDLDSLVLASLRAGAAQLIILNTPSHAAVSATVSALFGHSAKGMVNAVLRRLASEGEPDISSAVLHEKWSHPASLTSRWISAFGKTGTEKLLEWNNSVPDIGGYVHNDSGISGSGRFLDGYRIFERTGANPILSSSDVYIQDEAAAIIAIAAAELATGGAVLEIGASPGGKTHHLQRSADFVISLDSNELRIRRWIENRDRLRWENCFPIVADGRTAAFNRGFDLVFIDAPCTNTGVYRRRSDARWKWSTEFLNNLVELQSSLLASARELVAPGGFLIYSTCSLEDEENTRQVELFEENTDCFHRWNLSGPDELVRDGMICIFPPDHGIDGLFAAAWRRAQ